jgi:hypothetical protein
MDCLIWGSPAENKGMIDADYFKVISHRTGGGYRFASSAHHLVRELTTEQKKKLTTWLVQQRRSGEEYPFVTASVIENLSSCPPMRFADRVCGTLRFFAEHLSEFGKQFHLATARGDDKPLHLLAETACTDLNELRSFLHLMVAAGLLTDHGPGRDSFALTPKGWERIDELQRARPSTTQAFVAMWFDPTTDAAYTHGFEPAIRDTGHAPLRIDRKEHINKIDDEIIAEIRRSRFLVADFTCEPKRARGGVYFEAGFAMALPIPVIWACHNASIDDLHFDTRQYAHIVWEQPEDLYKQLKARIGAVIGDGPLSTHIGP